MTQEITVEKCGCEFTHIWDDNTGDSCCFLSKCNCQKHYDEQLKAEWTDQEGHHLEMREPLEVDGLLPLESN